jgi:hypothetical protein
VELTVVRMPEWPPLAWVAECRGDLITAYVGGRVEVGDGWFAEAAWDGPFTEGGFDRTEVVCGSGVRIRDRQATFVSAASTIDRLHSVRVDDATCVSNSLAGLLAFTGGSLALGCTRYEEIFLTIIGGLARYERELPTTVGPVRLTYFHNLVWDGSELREVEKPFELRDFATYDPYRAFLGGAVQGLADNARSPQRSHPLGLVATVSSGYDSATAAALAREAGCTEAFGYDADSGGRDDDGTATAEALGLHFHLLETAAGPAADVLFLAAGTGDGGDAVFRSAEGFLAGRLAFFGHWGDAIWGFEDMVVDRNVVRYGRSGTSFLEYRLVAGFIQCAVPMLGGRQLPELRALGRSAELQPWSIGGDYDRPVARRILEEMGVPREAFGMKKRGVFGRPPRPSAFLTPELRADYQRWLHEQRLAFVRQGAVPPTPTVDLLTRRLRRVDVGTRRRFHRYVIHWAVDRTKDRYPRP